MSTAFEQLIASLRRHPLLVSGLVIFAVLSLANYFLWLKREEAARRHEEAQHRGEAMLLALTDNARVTSDTAAVQKALQLIDRNLIIEGSMAKNLGYFFQLETISHVRISQLNQLVSQPTTDGSPFKAIPFSVRANGSYSQVIRFLRELENGPRLLRIRSYSFTKAEPVNNALIMDLTVELLGSP
jgi:Tfp pilus assembly protein PilO